MGSIEVAAVSCAAVNKFKLMVQYCVPWNQTSVVTLAANLSFFFSLQGTLTSLLWANKPWASTSPTSMCVWTRWLMCCTTLRNHWSPPDPWSTCASESCLQVTHSYKVRLMTSTESCMQSSNTCIGNSHVQSD